MNLVAIIECLLVGVGLMVCQVMSSQYKRGWSTVSFLSPFQDRAQQGLEFVPTPPIFQSYAVQSDGADNDITLHFTS